MQVRGEMFQEKTQRFNDLGRSDDVEIVQHQDSRPLKLTQIIQEGYQRHFQRLELKGRQARSEQQIQSLLSQSRGKTLTGCDDITPETDGIVIALIQGYTGYAREVRPRCPRSYPLGGQGCLAIAS